MPEITGHDFPEYAHREWPKWVNGVLCENETDAAAAGPASTAPVSEVSQDHLDTIRHSRNRAELVAARAALTDQWKAEDAATAAARQSVLAAYDQGMKDWAAATGKTEQEAGWAADAAPMAVAEPVAAEPEPVAPPPAEPPHSESPAGA